MEAEISKLLAEVADAEADSYEAERGHGFSSPEENDAWREDIAQIIAFSPGSTALDVGCGTGVFTRMVMGWVGSEGYVVATDLSTESLRLNKMRLPPDMSGRVSFVLGDVHDSTLLDGNAHLPFDYITCRQGVCLFEDPLTVFGHWWRWLKPGGQIVILDGLWTRRSWAVDERWAALVDKLPLSCIQTTNTVRYLLERTGFAIEHVSMLDRVNDWYRRTQNDVFDTQRYIVIAAKPRS
jgi:ubiquinone/menaquinone biosynthesis C-methylase UbiE